MILCSIIGCSSYKEKKDQRKKNHKAYVAYLVSRNIDTIKANDLDYYDDFFEFKKQQKKYFLLNHKCLKTNKVYVYQGGKVITFCVYADNGELYITEINKKRDVFLENPENGKIKLSERVNLIALGFFELENNTIKNTRYEKTPRKEWYDCNVGIVKQDTITIVEDYRTNKYGSYKKKWLTKTLKTSYNLIYQPDLKATKFKNEFGFDSYFIEGSFNFERDLKEEAILKLMEKVR